MSEEHIDDLKPFVSLLIVVMTLFCVVFIKMEERRVGYTVLRETRQYRALKDRYRLQLMQYAKTTRPERVREMAVSRLTMNEPRSGQIIQLTGQQIALPQ